MSTNEIDEHDRRQRRAQAEQTQQAAAIRKGVQDSTTTKNPAFVEEFTSLELDDSDIYDWLADELGPLVNNQHALGNRGADYGFQRWLLNRNTIERYIAERTPARQCREHAKLLALGQGIRGWARGHGPESDNPPEDYREPIGDRKRRVLRSLAELLTTHQSLSEGGEGADMVSTVRTETRTEQVDEAQERGVAARLSGGLFG